MIPKDYMISFAREALGLSESVPIELSLLEGRGSDRTFFRLRWNREDSVILIHYNPKRVENMFYADIATFLRDISVPVPRLIRHDPTVCLIAMEDLGNTDLWSVRKKPWEIRRVLYQKTLTIAHRLHSFPETDFPPGRVRLMESFGPDLYRWERDYFKDHFVRAVCGIKLETSFERELEAELSSLAECLSGPIRHLVHRDLQSQNVMIRDGEPFLIDFQGMRFGSPFYDLGSLLCDSYVNLSSTEREELLSYYYGLGKSNFDWDTFQKTFWEASVQRLMQALAAYGYLGLEKGLKPYLEHIPSGLLNLRLATSHVPTLLRLRELSLKCQRAVGQKGELK
jgi:aminoglycoside/choline kinase family phosphotransferase